MQLEKKLKKEVCDHLGIHTISKKDWHIAVDMSLNDMYINYLCSGKDIYYEHFVKSIVISLNML